MTNLDTEVGRCYLNDGKIRWENKVEVVELDHTPLESDFITSLINKDPIALDAIKDVLKI
jgi:hypothetical protein